MAVSFNHTLISCVDRESSAKFLAEVLGLKAPVVYGPFLCVETDNKVSLDFMQVPEQKISPQHYAFLISDEEFDQVFGRIQARSLRYWADPHQQRPGEINHNDGGRGVYFQDLNGHLLEVLTRPYGSGE